jgi:hypothetical protein
MQRSEIPVHRYHFMSRLNDGRAVPDPSKMRVQLRFGDAATLDLSKNTYMLAVESLAFSTLDPTHANTYALYISNTGFSSTRCTSEDVGYPPVTRGKIPALICGKDGVNVGNVTRSYMGTVITNPNFLNDYVDIELLDGACGDLGVNTVLWFSGTFVVYRYEPN